MSNRLKQLQKRDTFNIKKLYLLQVPPHHKVTWKKQILQYHMQPSRKFNLWLALQ